MEWISVDKELPSYGEPVLLKASGVVQNVTYTLDGDDDTPDWFEPYHFDHDDNCKMFWDRADSWQYLPE